MNKQELVDSLHKIEPDEQKKQRIWNKITARQNEKRVRINYRIAVPALSLVLIVAAGTVTMSFLNGSSRDGLALSEAGDLAGGISGEMTAMVFFVEIDGKKYIKLGDDLSKEYGFPQAVTQDQLGEKIATLTDTSDRLYIGKDAYFYKPAGCEAVVAVQTEGGYELFRFFSFISYENNQDEDAAAYLNLYGINNADDIAKIQFIGYSEQAKLENRVDIKAEIADRTEMDKFYGFFSILKNASDDYFSKLYGSVPQSNVSPEGNSAASAPADAPDITLFDETGSAASEAFAGSASASDESDMVILSEPTVTAEQSASTVSSSVSGSIPGSAGIAGDAFVNPQSLRIYNNSGLYFEILYYPNISFISRYAVTPDFADFLAQYIK